MRVVYRYVYDAAATGGFTFPSRVPAKVLAILTADGFVDNLTVADDAAEVAVGVVLDRTCFYAEQGGQVGDFAAVTGVVATVVAAVMSRGFGVLYVLWRGRFLMVMRVRGNRSLTRASLPMPATR